MAEYINKQLAVEELENLRQQYEMHDDCDELVARRCKDAVSALQAADVAPVEHGMWVEKDFPGKPSSGNGIAICSVCGEMSHKAEHGYPTAFSRSGSALETFCFALLRCG